MSTKQLSHTEEIISALVEMQDEVLNNIPECFIEQARNAASAFYVDTDLLSHSAYERVGGGETDLIRIVLEDPKIHDESLVSVKFRLSGLMDPDSGELIPMSKRSTADGGEWLKGFRSNRIGFTQAEVDSGLISQEDFNNIISYAHMWAEISEEEGVNAMYSKEHAKKRLWLVASDEDALLTFEIELRTNPQDDSTAVGMTNVRFRNLHVIGVGTTQAPAELSEAAEVKKGKSRIEIPNFRNRAASTDDEDEEGGAVAPAAPKGGKKPTIPSKRTKL
jgi:hypothetical protein